MSRAREVVEVVARALAGKPDAVTVTEAERRGQTVIELSMAPGELGRVIGRQGRTATALRTIAAAAGELDGQRTVVQPRGNLRCGDTGVLRTAAVQGLGVLMLGSFALAEDLQAGRLVPILTDYTIGEFGVFAVYANRRFLPPKVRLFVDSLVNRFGPDPQLDPFLRPSA